MTSPTPDLSSLHISSQQGQQRPHDNYDFEAPGNGRQHYFTPAHGLSSQPNYGNLGQSPMKAGRPPARGGLPNSWMDTVGGFVDSRSLSPHNSSDLSSSGSPPPMGHLMGPTGMSTPPVGPDDEVIPTAIVIKNIPFNVKKETLLDIIASLAIPTPYAFNYHLDQSGAFRGLAFANFRQPSDADAVVAALNGFDVQGRKLRVEYKKVLQAGEKERIEREKALRRIRSVQLEKESIGTPLGTPYGDYGGHQMPPGFSPARSFSAGNVFQQTEQYSPPRMPPMGNFQQQYNAVSTSPVPQGPLNPSTKPSSSTELDLNDAATLEIYSRILLFKDDPMRDELAFSRTLSAKQRRVVHLVAQKLGVFHYSIGEGEERYAVVTRINPEAQQQQQQRQPHSLSRAPSAYHLSSSGQPPISNALRVKKSMPDMNALRMQAPRLTTRMSNGNMREGMREGYATIASPARRSPGALNALFGNGAFGGAPPVPTLPASVSGVMSPSAESPSSTVVRQPKGPGVAGFMNRRPSEQRLGDGGLNATTHEPLEI